MSLNEEQKKAVEHFDVPCLVISCPGSGKTLTLVERTARLIEKGVKSKNILCITFTNKAGGEMKERILKRLNIQKTDFYVGTFHALCANLLRMYGDRLGYNSNFTILDDSDQHSMVEKIIRQLGKNKKDDGIDVDVLRSKFNHGRENLEEIEDICDDYENKLYGEIAREYFKQLKENNLIDFSGLLYNMVKILEENNDILEKLQNHFKYIQVDEFQDTNIAQFRFINLLGGKTANLLLVGDLNQSIYKFRNARPENIIDFLDLHKDCVKICLGKNYRSTPQIVKVADTLIKHNKSNMSENFETDNKDGDPVLCNKLIDATCEAYFIAQKIKYYVNDLGYQYSDMAVLYRLNKMSLELQTAFTAEQIPFVVIGGFNFFDRKEIKDAIAMMKFAMNNKDVLSFHKIANLFPGIGETNIGLIENISKINNIPILEVCQKIEEFSNRIAVKKAAYHIYEIYSSNTGKMNAGDCLSHLLEKFDYFNYLEKNEKIAGDSIERIENLKELVNNATNFSKKNSSLEAYLQNIALISTNDKENNTNSVTMTTGHGAKGLEWSIVFSVGVEQNILPHIMAINEGETHEGKLDAIEEERRLAFVIFSRAKKHLHITYCQGRKFRSKYGSFELKAAYPSQFLYEAGLLKKDSDFERYKKEKFYLIR